MTTVQPCSAVGPETPPWLLQWCRWAADVRAQPLPQDVSARSRLVLLDSIGVIAAGAQEPEMVRIAERLAQRIGTGGQDCAVIGMHRRAPGPVAAFLNGSSGTMLELDEGNQFARGHPGIHVIPAALVAACRSGADGTRLLAAIAVGYELGARIGIAGKLRVTMHPHGTWGTVGAAIAAALLAGQTPDALARSVNVASSLGLSTSRRTMLEGGTVRNTFAGWSNQIGLTVADLVDSGFSGEADGVGTVYGSVIADGWDARAMTDELGVRWEILRNYFKVHACCRYNHAALDALADIVEQAGGHLDAGDVESIDVDTYVWAAQLAGQEPHNMLSAKFSLPFSVATYIVNGEASLAAFRDPAREHEATRALARRVRVREDPDLTAQLPALRPARVTLRLRDGRRWQAQVSTNRGDAENPYDESTVRAKFHALVEPIWSRAQARRIEALVDRLASAQDVIELDRLLATREGA